MLSNSGLIFIFINVRTEGPISNTTMPLFGSSKKSPVEMVKNIQESLQVLEKESSGGKKSDKVSTFLITCLSSFQFRERFTIIY